MPIVTSLKGELWNSVTEASRDLIRKMLQLDVTKRYSAKQVLEHPWFNQ